MGDSMKPGGESRSNATAKVDSTGDGAREVDIIESGNTAGHSQPSQKNSQIAPRATDLDRSEWLEILIQTVVRYRQANGDARIDYFAANGATVIVLPGVFYCAKCARCSIGNACANPHSGKVEP